MASRTTIFAFGLLIGVAVSGILFSIPGSCKGDREIRKRNYLSRDALREKQPQVELVGQPEDEVMQGSALKREAWADVREWAKGADFVVVGAGLSGAVLAERIAAELNKRVVVLEKRHHAAGTCFDFCAKDTGT